MTTETMEARLLAAEAAARGAAFREREAANEAAMLRAQVATAEALAAQRDELIATMLDAHEGHKRAAVYADRLLAEARAQVDALRARVDVAEAEAARRTDEVVAIGDALGREGATAGECVALIGELRARLTAALVACGEAGAERRATAAAQARADRSDALYQSVVQPALETLALCGEAMTAGLAECERLRAIIDGREAPPTDAEIDAHETTDGAWLVAGASGAVLCQTADALRWVLGGTPRVVDGPWHDAHDGATLVVHEGGALRTVAVSEWVRGDGWTYGRGDDGVVWVLDDGRRVR